MERKRSRYQERQNWRARKKICEKEGVNDPRVESKRKLNGERAKSKWQKNGQASTKKKKLDQQKEIRNEKVGTWEENSLHRKCNRTFDPVGILFVETYDLLHPQNIL